MTNEEKARKALLGIIKSVYADNIHSLAKIMSAEADNDNETIVRYAELFVDFINKQIDILKDEQ